jgi:hypothetical protein
MRRGFYARTKTSVNKKLGNEPLNIALQSDRTPAPFFASSFEQATTRVLRPMT